jgi:hypothetical protein
MKDKLTANHPAPSKTGITFPMTIEHHRTGQPDPGR